MNRYKIELIMSTIWLIVLVIISVDVSLPLLMNVEEQQDQNHPKLQMTDKSDHLVWFLQISDIHISAFKDPSRITEFKEFCKNAIEIFKPPLVIASGDLTDGRASNTFGTGQIQKEWYEYQNVLVSLNISQYIVWLDIRGNHDTFNVLDLKSKENYFTNYSIQGKAHPRSYLYQLKHNGDIYSFIAIDATLQTGPRFPFNFAGFLDAHETKVVNDLMKQVESSHSNYTIWFGHYPTSCVVSQEVGGIRSLVGNDRNGFTYLCGHLHRLVPEMYTMQPDGFLELELGDWKTNRMFRLLAIDHGLLSFVDTKHQDWPLVLVTNPKHALFVIPHKENVEITKESTHVRLLVFSSAPIESVKVQIDNEVWKDCRNIDGPLYVAAWDPSIYSTGLHSIKIHVQDAHGRSKYETHPFSLDGSKLSFAFFPTFLLKTNANTLFKLLFWILDVLILAPLLVVKWIHYRDIKNGNADCRSRSQCGCFRKLYSLSSMNRIYWPLVVYQVYISMGPWTVGSIIEDRIGAIFVWGILVNGVFLTGSFTYLYGSMQLLIFQLPIIFIFAHGVDHRFQLVLEPRRVSWLSQFVLHVPFSMILAFQLVLAFFFALAYGILACLMCPLHTWVSIFITITWVHNFSILKHHAL